MNSKISLVIPVFNESIEIDNFFNDLSDCDFNIINEIIFIDDCSTDNSYELLKKKINEFKSDPFKINFILLWYFLFFVGKSKLVN